MLKNGFSYGFIQKIAVLYLIAWTISPPLQVDTIYRIIALACAGIWVVIWFIRETPITLGKEQIGAIFFLITVSNRGVPLYSNVSNSSAEALEAVV